MIQGYKKMEEIFDNMALRQIHKRAVEQVIGADAQLASFPLIGLSARRSIPALDIFAWVSKYHTWR